MRMTKAQLEHQLALCRIAMQAALNCHEISKARDILRKELNHTALREVVK